MSEVLNIKVEIKLDSLKKLVAMGKLGEFMDRLSMELGNVVKTQTTEAMVKAGIGKTAIGGVSIAAAFDDDGPWFGTKPHPPRPWGLSSAFELSQNASVIQIVLPTATAAKTNTAQAKTTKAA